MTLEDFMKSVAALAVLVVLFLAFKADGKRESIPSVGIIQKTYKTALGEDVAAFRFEGHDWIEYSGRRSDTIIHHPSCDCLKTEVKP